MDALEPAAIRHLIQCGATAISIVNIEGGGIAFFVGTKLIANPIAILWRPKPKAASIARLAWTLAGAQPDAAALSLAQLGPPC